MVRQPSVPTIALLFGLLVTVAYPLKTGAGTPQGVNAPGAGTRITLNGADKGLIEGGDFKEAPFSVWLGDVPPSPDLKKGMLGRP